jgi:hypothetical protein
VPQLCQKRLSQFCQKRLSQLSETPVRTKEEWDKMETLLREKDQQIRQLRIANKGKFSKQSKFV